MSCQIKTPSCTFAGNESIKNLKVVARKEEVKKALIFTDKGVTEAGLTELVTNELDELGVKYEVLRGIAPEPAYTDVQRIVDEADAVNGDIIIAVGGGSVMDAAKLVSLLKGSDIKVKDLLKDPFNVEKQMKTVMIPTTCGTGAEATCNAVVAVPEEESKMGIVNDSMIPDYVILDARTIEKLPAKIIAATGVDALAHVVECFTSRKATVLSDTYAAAGARLIFHNIEKAYGDASDIDCLIEGCRQAAYVALPTAACGIMIGTVVRSGAAVKIAKLITSSGNSSLFIALAVAAAGCILLGMALPTSAAYLLGNVLFASAIQGLDISALSANMFLFYFGVIAQITPPVCVASYTAAGIAGASAWKTGWKAFTFALTAFLVPFLFVYQPAILLQGSITEIIYALIVVLLGTLFLAVGVAGWFFKSLTGIERAVCFAAAITLIMPSAVTDFIGMAIGLAFMAYCFVSSRKRHERAE